MMITLSNLIGTNYVTLLKFWMNTYLLNISKKHACFLFRLKGVFLSFDDI